VKVCAAALPADQREGPIMKQRMMTALAVAAALGLALGLGAAAAHAGPCSDQIAQFEQAVRQSAGTVGAGPTEQQSVGAQLRHQPTPGSVAEAEAQAQASFQAMLARAKQLDAEDNRACCMRALAEAERRFNLQ
jgi:hypothetical protein